jgi:hypothetical protein
MQASSAAVQVRMDSFRASWTAPSIALCLLLCGLSHIQAQARKENFPWWADEIRHANRKKTVAIWLHYGEEKTPVGATTHKCRLMIAVMKHSVILDQLLPGVVIKLEIPCLQFLEGEFEKIPCVSLHHHEHWPLSINCTNTDDLHRYPSLVQDFFLLVIRQIILCEYTRQRQGGQLAHLGSTPLHAVHRLSCGRDGCRLGAGSQTDNRGKNETQKYDSFLLLCPDIRVEVITPSGFPLPLAMLRAAYPLRIAMAARPL